MKRRDFLRTIIASGTLIPISEVFIQDACRKIESRPNFIVFLADDLGYGDLGCYGHPIIKTPNLDKFAKEGVILTDCHSAGTVCSPSRASLLTGRNPFRVGIYYLIGGGAHLPRKEVTIASLLKEAGYDTCFVGKWHLSQIDEPDSHQPTPSDHGFDYWLATKQNAFEGPENPLTFIRNGKKVGEIRGWYCDLIVEEAINWIKNRPNSKKPFFLLICSHEPHAPLDPPHYYSDMYYGPEIDRMAKNIRYGGVDRDRSKFFGFKKYYYGTVTQLDNAFGRLLKAIDDFKMRENTLIFFTSDNGPEVPPSYIPQPGEEIPTWVKRTQRCFGTPGVLRGMKRSVYEGGHRVPGIIRWPRGIKPGTVSDALVNGTDILPTFCELAGVPVPNDRVIDGISIVSIFEGREPQRPIPATWMFPAGYPGPHMAMREDSYVIIGWFNTKERDQLWMDYIKSARLEKFELYNLRKDIEQKFDLTSKEPEVLVKLESKMKKLWAEIQSEGPIWEKWTRK